VWTVTPAVILILIAFPSFKLLYLMDEVNDSSMSVLAEGFFFNGLKLFILYVFYKIKDAWYQKMILGEKNNIYVSNWLAQVKDTGKLYKNNQKVFSLEFKRTFHTKIRASSRIGPHNQDVLSVVIGSLLGDSYANARTIEGTRISYRQSEIHIKYLFWLYEFYLERGYCSNLKPRKYTRKLKDKEYYGYEFNTFTFRSFNWIHKLFYKNGKKYINPKLEFFLTPLALAIWIMDSRTKFLKTQRLVIYTEFKNSNDLKSLSNILISKFGLYNIEGLYEDKNVIFIHKESVEKLQALVAPHILPYLSYKVGLSYKNTCLLSSSLKTLSDSNKIVKGYRYYSNSVDNSISIIASYLNPFEIRSFIYKENKDKAGIYRWINLNTGETYIGSSANLANRFADYLSTNFLTREVNRTKSIIYASLLKNGYSNFKLEILEYCDSSEVLVREQYYLDLCQPEYNILKIAGSTLGYKHTEETLAKFKQRKLSEESLEKLRSHLVNLNLVLNEKKRIEVLVYDFYNNKETLYASIAEAAKDLEIDTKTVWQKSTIDNKEIIPFKGRYIITKLSDGQTKQDHINRIESAKINLDKGLEKWKNALGKRVIVSNIVTNEMVIYNTISEAAIALSTSRPTITRRIKDKKPFNNAYIIYYENE
jgi:hypothetical protein